MGLKDKDKTKNVDVDVAPRSITLTRDESLSGTQLRAKVEFVENGLSVVREVSDEDLQGLENLVAVADALVEFAS